MKIVEVEWFDACIDDAIVEVSCAELMVGMWRRNVGYLVREDKKDIVISFGTVDNLFKNSHAVHEAFAIPRGCVKKIRTLH